MTEFKFYTNSGYNYTKVINVDMQPGASHLKTCSYQQPTAPAQTLNTVQLTDTTRKQQLKLAGCGYVSNKLSFHQKSHKVEAEQPEEIRQTSRILSPEM